MTASDVDLRGLQIEVVDTLAAVSPEAWDALVDDGNPFVSHAFLQHLETSGSVGGDTGWIPRHVIVRDGARVVAAAPTYVKLHSYGEFIFDWAWADAANRAGIDYYPKLVVAAPHTPATGPRLLVHPGADRARLRLVLASATLALARELEVSSAHVLFARDDEIDALTQVGFHRRATHQYHFRNDGWPSFDAFLGALRSEVRKQIKKERRRVAESGLTIAIERGDRVSDADWREMDRLYRSTSGRKWGAPYLTPRFFHTAREAIGASALLCFARRGERIVAGTLSFTSNDTLFGRYWGTHEDVDGLHFELCYYRLIEYALENGMRLVEAGAQGEHKVKRGYLPVVTHSAHAVLHPGLDEAIARFLAKERVSVARDVEAWAKEGPFRDDARPRFPLVAGVPLLRDN